MALGGGLCKWDGRETWSAEHRSGGLSANRVIFEADYKHHYYCNIIMAELTFLFLRVSIRTQCNIRKPDLEVMLELVGFLQCHGREA